jgi:putative membrane protein insertion efficiency factor
MKYLLISLIRAYQYFISPWLGQNCRFDPTCSQYAKLALERYGAFWGLWLTIKRLVRCNPFFHGGHDPVPEEGGNLKVRPKLLKRVSFPCEAKNL